MEITLGKKSAGTSSLFRGGSEGEIRRGMLEEDLVEAVVGLPKNLFYGTGISAALIIATRAKPADRVGKLLMVDASEGFDDDHKQWRLRESAVKRICEAYRDFVDVPQFARVVDLAEVRDNGWNLNLPLYAEVQAQERGEGVGVAVERLRVAQTAREEAEAHLRALLAELGHEY